MKRAGKTLLIGTVVTALGAAGTVYAYAGGWTVEGQVEHTAQVAKMPRGVEPSVAKQSRQAVVTWSAQEIAPGVPMDHYVVTAHSDVTPPKPDVTHTVAASGGPVESLTFTAAEVAGGKWRWTIIPKFKNWTGAESPASRRLGFPAAPADSVTSPLALGGEVATGPASNEKTTPGATNPAAINPGAANPGTTNPGAANPGATSPAAPKPGQPEPKDPQPTKAGESTTAPATEPDPAPPGPAEPDPGPDSPVDSGPAAPAAG